MRPDIDAGPVGRKCSASNGPPGDAFAGAGDCPERPTIDCAPDAAARMRARAMNRYCLMEGLQQAQHATVLCVKSTLRALRQKHSRVLCVKSTPRCFA